MLMVDAPVSEIPQTYPDSAPQKVLDLVPGSTSDDWGRHSNPDKSIGGWVYKTAKVSPSARVNPASVVYEKAVIGKICVITGSTITGIVGDYNSISNSTIHGRVGTGCTIVNSLIEANTVVNDSENISKTPVTPRTQKARGVSALFSSGKFNTPVSTVYRIEELTTDESLEPLLNKFVRPCPVKPRHGFVDSRPIKELADARQIVSEAAKADKDSEIIVMPFVQASHSAVWTDGQLTIGPRNDGATAGRECYVLTVQGVPNKERTPDWNHLLRTALITDAPYLEILWRQTLSLAKHSVYETAKHGVYETIYVQLRNGPKLPQTVDFVPIKTTVKHLLKAEGDLLAWETTIKSVRPGTVVYHPGGSLASHYAVHAYLSNVPVITSRKPKVGEILEPNITPPTPDINNLRKGFLLGCKSRITFHQAAYIMLAGCHSTTQWLGRHDLILGMALGCVYRLIVTAALGEYRHRDSHVLHNDTEKPSRDDIYESVWNRTLHISIRSKFADALSSFDKEAWKGSFGGPAWFLLSRWAALIYNALVDGDINTALESLNKGVNSIHNGGWTFNKFLPQTEMNLTASNPIYAVLKVAPIIYDSTLVKVTIGKKFDKTKEFKLEKIDPEKYLESRNKKPKQPTPATGPLGKVCCQSDCCGNPECIECHPTKQETNCSACGDSGDCCSKCNSCYSHGCEICYPDGCDCCCTDCHDAGCYSCENEYGDGEYEDES